MSATEKIKIAFGRVSHAISRRPATGRGTKISRASIKNGLTCEIREANWTMIADMPELNGGGAKGPTPGVYGRAALGSCLAIGYMMRAAAMDIPIEGIEVEIQADYDDAGFYGIAASIPAAYPEFRYLVRVDSQAPEEMILRMLDEADRRSPYLEVYQRGQSCRRQVIIITEKKA